MLKRVLIILTGSLILVTANAQIPANAVAFYKKGLAFKEKEMLPEALQSFKKAVQLSRKYDSAYVQLGDIYSKMINTDTALLNYNKALAINPKQVLAYMGLGNLYRDAKHDFDLAISNYLNASKIDSSRKEIFYGIAWCYNAKKEYEKTIPFAIKALDLDNNYKAGYNELGHAYHALKKYHECIEQLKKNIAISPVDLPLYYSGLCYIELKDQSGAMSMYEELKKMGAKMAEGLKKKIDAVKNWSGN